MKNKIRYYCWSQAEINFLKGHYGKIKVNNMIFLLKKYPIKRIFDKARRLGLKSNRAILIKSRNNPFFEKHHTKETCNTLSKKALIRFKEVENHPFFNRHHKKETKLKISKLNTKYRFTKNGLLNLYTNKEMTCDKIASLYGCDAETIRLNLIKFRIKRRKGMNKNSPSKATRQKLSRARKKIWVDEEYRKKAAMVRKKQFAEKTLDRGITKEILTNMYVKDKLSIKEISEKLQLSSSIILNYMNHFCIKRRDTSESQKIIWSSEAYKDKMIKLAKIEYKKRGGIKHEWTEADKKRMSINSRNWWHNPANKYKIEQLRLFRVRNFTGRKFSKDWRKNISIERKNRWKNPNYAINWNIKNNISPTQPEIIVEQICKLNNLPFRFVGDGKLSISSFNPDFINDQNKMIIEVFSEYHHKKIKDVVKRDRRRIYTYKKLGYKLLILWSLVPLRNPQKATEKIINFCSR